LLGQLLQSVKHTFFNHAPSIGYDESQNTQGRNGVLTGALNGSDADGDAVTYKVVQGPASGSVIVNADGTFTYTPTAALANTGGTDSFVVAANDGAAGKAHTSTTTINVAVHAPNTGITVYNADVNRLDIIVNDSYADFKAKFAAAVPGFSPQVLQILVKGTPNLDALKAAITANAPNGFITFTTINTGALLTVAGVPAENTNAVQYLFGNPVFAEQMYKEDRSTQLYAPLRATIYQAADGTVHFVLDQPSTSFGSFDDPTIDGVGQFLDGEVAHLLTVLGAPVPDVLTEQSA
jgi:VCBS repeat-containing protein